jgi:hypothetical protein
MQYKRASILFLFAGMGLIVAAGIFLATATPVGAQCGSQASSCKNCHEVQAQDSVNNDGTSWHQSHAFGDFCYICHAGNQQATDQDTAHTGMLPPLQDVKASCQQCHPDDLQARAQVYATTLGVAIGAGAATPAPGAASPATPPLTDGQGTTTGGTSALTSFELSVDDPNLVDYVQHYDEIVLGKHPVNWGNVILITLIGLVVVGGGGFVVTREKLVNVSFGDTGRVEGEFPADVVEMVPEIASLKPKTRASLKRVLANPRKAEKVLGLMDAVVSDEETQESEE